MAVIESHNTNAVSIQLPWQHFEQDKINGVTFAILCGKGWDCTVQDYGF